MTEQKPSICRMVVFSHRSTKDSSKPLIKSPAVIQEVNEDGTVQLAVLPLAGGAVWFKRNVEQGDAEYQWNWPPR